MRIRSRFSMSWKKTGKILKLGKKQGSAICLIYSNIKRGFPISQFSQFFSNDPSFRNSAEVTITISLVYKNYFKPITHLFLFDFVVCIKKDWENWEIGNNNHNELIISTLSNPMFFPSFGFFPI